MFYFENVWFNKLCYEYILESSDNAILIKLNNLS